MRAVELGFCAALSIWNIAGWSNAALAQTMPDVTTSGNPAIAPLKWEGLLLNVIDEKAKQYSYCTAQFISPRVVLTAAHCVQDAETGEWADQHKLYFLRQYQNNSSADIYRPVCLSRFDGWWPRELKDNDEQSKLTAEINRRQWDYALILVDHAVPDQFGYYNFALDWKGKYSGATDTGYPGSMLGGEIIQIAHGEITFVSDIPNVVALKHNQRDLTEGSSGGAWVADFSQLEDVKHNVILSINSFLNAEVPGVTFGPYLTSDFNKLLQYVSNGCK